MTAPPPPQAGGGGLQGRDRLQGGAIIVQTALVCWFFVDTLCTIRMGLQASAVINRHISTITWHWAACMIRGIDCKGGGGYLSTPPPLCNSYAKVRS